MKKWIFLSLLCGMLAVGGVLGLTETSWANEEKNLTLPDGLFDGSSNFELRYESGSLDPASLNGSATGVRFFEDGKLYANADKVSIVSTGSLTTGDWVVKELVIDSFLDSDGMSVERMTGTGRVSSTGGGLVIEELVVNGIEFGGGLRIGEGRINDLPLSQLMTLSGMGMDTPFFAKLKRVMSLLNGSSMTLNNIHATTTKGNIITVGKVAVAIRDDRLEELSVADVAIQPSVEGYADQPLAGQVTINLKSFRFKSTGEDPWGISGAGDLTGLVFRPIEGASPLMKLVFEKLGMEEVVIEMGFQNDVTTDQEEALLNSAFALVVLDYAALKYVVGIRIKKELIEMLAGKNGDFTAVEGLTDNQVETMLDGLLFDHADITLTNWNMVDILLKGFARQGGQTEEQLRMTAAKMINMFVGRTTPILEETTDALLGFLEKPGTLNVTMAPSEPILFAAFEELAADPASLPEALGMSVTFLDEPLSVESYRLTNRTGSNTSIAITAGVPKALPPMPDSNVLDWLTARRAYAEEDYETVLRLMVPHAEIGTESAQRVVAHSYRKSDEFEQAATWYQGLAEKGDAASQFYLGMLYQKGLGVEQDNQVALEWLEKATAQGDARAIHALALSTQTIEVLKGINPGLSARAQEVLTDVVRHYYDTDDPAGMHFSAKSDVLIPTALWGRIIARWRTEGVMPSHVILQAVAGEVVRGETSTATVSGGVETIATGNKF